MHDYVDDLYDIEDDAFAELEDDDLDLDDFEESEPSIHERKLTEAEALGVAVATELLEAVNVQSYTRKGKAGLVRVRRHVRDAAGNLQKRARAKGKVARAQAKRAFAVSSRQAARAGTTGRRAARSIDGYARPKVRTGQARLKQANIPTKARAAAGVGAQHARASAGDLGDMALASYMRRREPLMHYGFALTSPRYRTAATRNWALRLGAEVGRDTIRAARSGQL